MAPAIQSASRPIRGKIPGPVFRLDLYLDIRLHLLKALQGVAIFPLGFLPQRHSQCIGVVVERDPQPIEAIAEIHLPACIAQRMGVVQRVISDPQIEIEQTRGRVGNGRKRAGRRGNIDRAIVGELIREKVRRDGRFLQVLKGAGQLLLHGGQHRVRGNLLRT